MSIDLMDAKIRELSEIYDLSSTESEELERLLIEMREKNFKYSKELSNFIKDKRLGEKYPNISGIVKMQEGDTSWDFNGGFPRSIYKIICKELGLKDQGSSARAVGFTSYKNL